MARIRQQYPQNYGSSGNINTEFESVIRYLNAAELGNNTVGELLAKLFNSNGDFDGPVEFRKDASAGIQYRIGEYADADTGWITLVTLDEIRGESGVNFGEIGAPIIFGRVDTVATASQTVFAYAHDSTDELLVYVDGVLKAPGASNDYTSDDTAGAAGQVKQPLARFKLQHVNDEGDQTIVPEVNVRDALPVDDAELVGPPVPIVGYGIFQVHAITPLQVRLGVIL